MPLPQDVSHYLWKPDPTDRIFRFGALQHDVNFRILHDGFKDIDNVPIALSTCWLVGQHPHPFDRMKNHTAVLREIARNRIHPQNKCGQAPHVFTVVL